MVKTDGRHDGRASGRDVAGRAWHRSPYALAAAFLAPTLLFLAVFTYWPLVTSAFYSFHKWDISVPAPVWDGLANYRNVLGDTDVLRALRNTLAYVAISVPIAVAYGLAGAVAVNGSGGWRLAARTLIFHPVLLPTVAIAAIWLFLLNPVAGPVPDLLDRWFGIRAHLLAKPGQALVTVALVGAYKNAGLYMLFFLAGLQGIPRELHDAARVDGAGEARIFRAITWPLLTPVTFYVAVTAVLDALRNVDHIFVLTRGGPANGSNVILYEIYLKSFEFWNTGQAAALTVLFVIALLALALVAIPRLERGVHYEA